MRRVVVISSIAGVIAALFTLGTWGGVRPYRVLGHKPAV